MLKKNNCKGVSFLVKLRVIDRSISSSKEFSAFYQFKLPITFGHNIMSIFYLINNTFLVEQEWTKLTSLPVATNLCKIF